MSDNTMKAHNLIQQAVYSPEHGLYFKSAHVHDYVTITFADGSTYSIDGGTEYIRRGWTTGFDNARLIDMTLYGDDSFDKIVTHLLWGTRGRDGKQPLKWLPLNELETDHLQAILDTQPQIRGTIIERVIVHVLEGRQNTRADS